VLCRCITEGGKKVLLKGNRAALRKKNRRILKGVYPGGGKVSRKKGKLSGLREHQKRDEDHSAGREPEKNLLRTQKEPSAEIQKKGIATKKQQGQDELPAG